MVLPQMESLIFLTSLLAQTLNRFYMFLQEDLLEQKQKEKKQLLMLVVV